jgi:hypothetical protein
MLELLMLDFSPIERAYYQRILGDAHDEMRRMEDDLERDNLQDVILRLRQVSFPFFPS